MAAFSFGFCGDDIDDEADIDERISTARDESSAVDVDVGVDVAVLSHTLTELLDAVPSNLVYTLYPLSLSSKDAFSKQNFWIPRRDLFDIRAQLMVEDPAPETTHGPTKQLLAGLDADDIKPNIYEGGFKTWECAADLAITASRWLDEYIHSESIEPIHVIELGAGTALPTMAMLVRYLNLENNARKGLHLTLCDYNYDVLRLATLPNLLLTWYVQRNRHADDEPETLRGDVEITSELREAFLADLEAQNISVSFLSGPWGEEFTKRALECNKNYCSTTTSKPATLVLGSETIYSPVTIATFTNTLMSILDGIVKAEAGNAKALIAAKKLYFGVGGGVDDFVQLVEKHDGNVEENAVLGIEQTGVSRTVLEITM